MDKDVHEKMLRTVGSIEAVSKAADMLSPMPCDKRTADNIEVARVALNKAIISAWEYANNAPGEQSK